MNQIYLGEFKVEIEESPFAEYKPEDWAMYFISIYSQIDGAHHKQWVLDQVARILKETPVIVTEARWEDGEPEYRVSLGEPSPQYLEWVKFMKGHEGLEYDYDEGIAP